MPYMTPFERHQHNQKPSSEQKTTNENKGQRIPWSDEVLSKASVNPRQATESPNKMWYMQENHKRKLRLENEIDINDIKAAAKGVINRWSAAVNKNPIIFRPVLENKPFDWKVVIAYLI